MPDARSHERSDESVDLRANARTVSACACARTARRLTYADTMCLLPENRTYDTALVCPRITMGAAESLRTSNTRIMWSLVPHASSGSVGWNCTQHTFDEMSSVAAERLSRSDHSFTAHGAVRQRASARPCAHACAQNAHFESSEPVASRSGCVALKSTLQMRFWCSSSCSRLTPVATSHTTARPW